MSEPAAVAIMAVLLFAPLTIRFVERNLEVFFLALGIVAMLLAGGPQRHLIAQALTTPIWISLAAVVAGLVFREVRQPLDRSFAGLRRRMRRSVLTAFSIFVIAFVSSVITAIIAALVLVEVIGLLHLERERRIRVAVMGCLAIGFGASLTPVGEPLSTIAAHSMGLTFFGLIELLGAYVVPGMAAASILGGWFGRGSYHEAPAGPHVRETVSSAFLHGLKVFGFVAGLVFISEAYAPLAMKYLPMVGDAALYWLNTVSAVLDNATLAAIEIHAMSADRAREAIIALLVSGGLLIPGNIPNIIGAGALRISSIEWARAAIPTGLAMLGIYFAVFQLLA